MKKTMKKKTLGFAVLTAIMMMNLGGCGGCNTNTPPAITTPTTAVTATTAPTVTPTTEPTAEPVFTPTVVSTPTEIPATPTPIPTPEPTATPVPTKAVAEGVKPIDSVKMGENVWYDFYEDGTLIVRGTGKTRDVDASFDIDTERVAVITYTDTEYDGKVSSHKLKVRTIVIEEGITELGDWSLSGFCFTSTVSFPSTLNTVGHASLYGTICAGTKCVGLRNDMKIGQYAFANFFDPNTNLSSEFKEYAIAPTLKPLPTATPLPNPDKPRLVEKKKMGDNITYEFWDNGYLYVKGTGATWDQSFYFTDFEGDFYQTIKNVIVEEGVTELGKNSLKFLWNISYWSLPRSLAGVKSTGGTGIGVTFDGYFDGKLVTIKTHNATHNGASASTFFEVLSDIDAAIAKGYEIIYH